MNMKEQLTEEQIFLIYKCITARLPYGIKVNWKGAVYAVKAVNTDMQVLLENVAEGALYHHERYDGNGYAHGLKGEQIPLNARIIGLADAFDAMTANRVYRKQLDLDFVLQEIKRCSGTQFDPNLVEILLRLIDNKTINVEQIYGSKNDIAGKLI